MFQYAAGLALEHRRRFNHEMHELHKMKKAMLARPGARTGGIFANPLTSKLEGGPSKIPLHSLRE